MRFLIFFWLILPFFICYVEASGQSSGIIFTHAYIDFPFEPATNGIGGFTANDFDSDGAMDISIQSDKSGEVFWYRNQGGGTWQRFVIATEIHRQLGATTLDVKCRWPSRHSDGNLLARKSREA
ncbi:MAG: VCBS repeat-containing protein [Bacteroidales bacterium]|nr:VCBS repeat-containing protein [Bacteroidales bacterium]